MPCKPTAMMRATYLEMLETQPKDDDPARITVAQICEYATQNAQMAAFLAYP